jgi:hypothetical protein
VVPSTGSGTPYQQHKNFVQGDLTKLGIPIRTVHSDVPAGAVTVVVNYAKAGDNRYTLLGKDGKTMHMLGTPIEELRKKHGGNTVYATDPWKKKHKIELDPAMPDGQSVYVIISFQFVKAGVKAS